MTSARKEQGEMIGDLLVRRVDGAILNETPRGGLQNDDAKRSLCPVVAEHKTKSKVQVTSSGAY